MSRSPLLPAFYFGSVEHYRVLAQHRKVIIDIGEHYERQSYRTRTTIVGPNGRQDLVVQIARRSGEKMPMRTVGLSYMESWPHQHVHAIRSAYGNTPWFIHYIDEIEAVVLKKYERLADLDLATLRLGMKWLGVNAEVQVSETYVDVGSPVVGSPVVGSPVVGSPVVGIRESEAGLTPPDLSSAHDSRTTHDYRTSLHPKKPLPPEITAVPPYPQVFADRHGFIPRMSVIDLVMNAGPQARRYLLG